jgi:hypothetical protein
MFVQFSIRQKQNLLEKPNSCMIDFKIRYSKKASLLVQLNMEYSEM